MTTHTKTQHRTEIRVADYEDGGLATVQAPTTEALADHLEALAAEALSAANAIRAGKDESA